MQEQSTSHITGFCGFSMMAYHCGKEALKRTKKANHLKRKVPNDLLSLTGLEPEINTKMASVREKAKGDDQEKRCDAAA